MQEEPSTQQQAAAGWYPNPEGGGQRYWDGSSGPTSIRIPDSLKAKRTSALQDGTARSGSRQSARLSGQSLRPRRRKNAGGPHSMRHRPDERALLGSQGNAISRS
jgi:hypothetical protein